ncbi:RNA-binding protein 7, partial [Manacus vitellinus]
QAGPVITVKIPKDRDGRPKQFAFVNFKHEESVPYGLQLLNGIKLYGRPMRIQFRSGSRHAAQDTSLSCSPLGAAGAIPPGMPHPASNCSRYERVTEGAGFPPSLQRQAVVCPWHTLTGSMGWSCLPFSESLFPVVIVRGCGNILLEPQKDNSRRSEAPGIQGVSVSLPLQAPNSPSLSPLPLPDEQHGTAAAPRGDSGFELRGHDAEHHYRGGRDEPYDDRHRDGWSHDYDHRRESYREAKWHLSRH